MTTSLYKVGDWVFCETSPFQPYVIRKIEELTKTPNGNVEAKVIFAYRKQDIPPAVMASVEKYQQKNSEKSADTNENAQPTCDYEESEVTELNELQRYQLKHRELYFSKFSDTIAATSIRSKCSVLLFNEEVERYVDYVGKDDSFYYHLTYDPYQKSIVADKGEIRVGMRYQAEIPALRYTPNGSLIEQTIDPNASQTSASAAHNDRVLRSQLAKMVDKHKDMPEIPISAQTDEWIFWCPMGASYGSYANHLTDADIDKFLIIAKSVGTYARALDCNNATKQPSLQISAACASRDITAFHALNALHDNNYDIGKALLSLITQNGPVLSKDQIEDWSINEANLFEDAMEKYGKDFNEIRKDFLPWKTLKSIIEYYYSWKTTDRYVQQKRIKLVEQESKLKQVYIPMSKQGQSALIKQFHLQVFQQYDLHLKSSCESCGSPTSSTNQWFVYNPSTLTQLIVSGCQNQTQLATAAAQAQAQVIATATANGVTNPSTTLYQARLCGECWNYWKKYASFKFPNAKQERLNQLKNQIHRCSVNGCGREFKQKQLLVKHCGVAHGYFAKTNPPTGPNSPRPPPIRNRTSFYLYTTPMTQAARLVCTKTIRMYKLARKPFKLVELAELNKEWNKEPRNIATLLEEFKKSKKLKDSKLTVELIDVIRKNRQKQRALKNGKKITNGHGGDSNGNNENSNDNEELMIDDQNDDNENEEDEKIKPEFHKYFIEKCTTPCFVPEKLLFAKPTSDYINKFFTNLMTQNRKRSHEQAGASSNDPNSNTNESSPSSKRTLLTNTHANNNGTTINSTIRANNNTNNSNVKPLNQQQQAPRQTVRSPTKAARPRSAASLANSAQAFYYSCTAQIKAIRQEIKTVSLKKLARKPIGTVAKQYQPLYATLNKIETDSLAKLGNNSTAVHNGNGNGNGQKADEDENTSSITNITNDLSKTNGQNGNNADDTIDNDVKMASLDGEEHVENGESHVNGNSDKTKTNGSVVKKRTDSAANGTDVAVIE